MSFMQPEVPKETTSTAAASAGKEELQRKPTDHLYWAKTSSVNAAPPPRQLTAEEAKRMEAAASSAGGSAWNKGGNTWEEKKIETWAHELLKSELLPTIAFEVRDDALPPSLPSEGDVSPDALAVRVTAVDKVTGECTYVLSRGKQRVVFELELKLKLEMEVRSAGELQTILSGTIAIGEVTNDDLSEAKMPSAKCTCEQAAPWKPAFEHAAKQSWPVLKATLEDFVNRAKEKWR